MTLVPASSHGGSQTQTATVTTDPNTFVAEQVFDLGVAGPHPVAPLATFVSAVPDGESFPGNPNAGLEVQLQVVYSQTSNFASSVTLNSSAIFPSGTGSAVATPGGGALGMVGDTAYGVGDTLRYAKVTLVINDNTTFTKYAGVHHPTATVRIDLGYL